MLRAVDRWAVTVGPLVLVLAGSPAAGQQPKDLSGRWELRDRADVEDPPATPPDEDELAPPGAPDGRRRPPPGRRQLREEDRQQLGRLLGMAQVVPAFELRQSDSALVVTNEDGFSYAVRLDGQSGELLLADSIRIRTRARWDDGHLVVEFEPDGGGKLTERYALADSRMYLRLEVTVEHDRLPRRVWRSRMYRRVD